MYQQLSAFFSLSGSGGDDAGGLSVPEFTEKIQTALQVLNHDPHYRYEHRFGAGEPPRPTPRPRLMFTWTRLSADGWVAVDVVARCVVSPTERPITITGSLEVTGSSDDESAAFADFRDYGAPFISAPGAFTGHIDAPGGLGGPINGATLAAYPHVHVGRHPDLRLEVLGPSGEVLDSVVVRRIQRTTGQRGVMVRLEEQNQIFSIDDRFDLTGMVEKRTLWFEDITGKPVDAVQRVYSFLAHCRAPNIGRFSLLHTPAVNPGRFRWGRPSGWVRATWASLVPAVTKDRHSLSVIVVIGVLPFVSILRFPLTVALCDSGASRLHALLTRRVRESRG